MSDSRNHQDEWTPHLIDPYGLADPLDGWRLFDPLQVPAGILSDEMPLPAPIRDEIARRTEKLRDSLGGAFSGCRYVTDRMTVQMRVLNDDVAVLRHQRGVRVEFLQDVGFVVI